MPGHGLSEGPSAEIENFSEYVEVLESCVEIVRAGNSVEALFMLGQSTGGASVAHYLMTGKYRAEINKAVLLAPLLRPKGWWSVNITWLLFHWFVKKVPRRFAVNSNDQQFLDFLANKDPLQPQFISIRWVGAMRKWVQAFSRFNNCSTPVLIVQGDDDNTVDWKYNVEAFQSRFSQSKVVILKKAKHHLVNESAMYQYKVQQVITDFLE
jgi:alpha-beta hydrolase superfamily lysophospholipase